MRARHRRQRHDADVPIRAIYAVGECVAHRGIAYGLVAPLFEQAKVCANHLAEFGIGRYAGSLTSTKLKVTGIDLFSAGDFMGGDGTEEIVMQRPVARRLQEARHQGRQAASAPCSTATRSTARGTSSCCATAAASRDIRDKLMFGESHHRRHRPRRAAAARAAMPDDAEVCGCNGVCKGNDLQGDQGAGPVHARRGAQAHQGQRVLRFVHRAGRADPDVHRRRRLLRDAEAEAVCGCTDHSHQEVRDAIREQQPT